MAVVSEYSKVPVGSRYEKLVTTGKPYPVRKYERPGRTKQVWEVAVKCDCGVETTALVWQLVGLRTISCGCSKRGKHSSIVFPGWGRRKS